MRFTTSDSADRSLAGAPPPGPRTLTPLGQLLSLRRDVLGFLSRLARDYGDVAAFRLGSIRVVLLNHPDHVQDVLVTSHRNFVKGRPLRLAKQLLGEGLLTSEGEFHARQSRIVTPALHPQRLSGYGPAVTDSALRLGRSWKAGAPVNILDEMIRLAQEIAGRTMFGWDIDSSVAAGIGRALDDAMSLFSRVSLPGAEWLLWLPLPSNRRFFRARAHLDTAILGMIEERRRRSGAAKDLLSMLLAARDAEGDHGQLSDRHLRDEALTLFLTAFDTVSLSLTWAWYALARNPEVESRLQEELDRVLGQRAPTVDDLGNLPYLRMVLSETLRLYPPIYVVAREALGPFSVGGYRVPAGTLVLMSPFLMQRDPRYFADPERFDPSRWAPSAGAKPPRFSYFPFGGGPRGCLGQAYAMQEAALVLATLAQQWRLRLAPGFELRLRPLVNLRPESGIAMIVEARSGEAPETVDRTAPITVDASAQKAGPATGASLPPRVRERYPFAARWLRLRSGHRMHYLDEGSGPPLVMLHGNPTWSFHYRDIVLGLRHRYRCIVPDHLGSGLSDKPAQWSYTIAGHTANVVELLYELDLHDATLVTHDWGGPIGYLAAVRCPGRFSRCITFNTALSLEPLPRALTMLRLPVLGPLVVRGLNGMLWAGFAACLANGHRLGGAVRAGYLAPYDSWKHRIGVLRFVQEIPLEHDHRNRQLFAELDRGLDGLTRLPHLVAWGLRDPVFHRGYLAAWQRRFPDAEIHAIEDAGHWVVEEAGDRILPLVREFLDRTGTHESSAAAAG